MNNPQFPTARKTGLVVQEVPNEVLVYDLETNKAHCLNNTAAIVWRSCDGKTSVSDIAKIVGKEAGGTISDDFVWLAIDQLTENNLLETEIAAQFAGNSRRDAIKKIGLASMIALPIVASLVAPKSAMASVSCVCTSVGTDDDPSCIAASCPPNCISPGVCSATPNPAVDTIKKSSR